MEKGFSDEDVAAVFIDEEKKEQIIFLKNQLINQLQRICPKIAVSFDNVYPEELSQISEELSIILAKQYVGYKSAYVGGDELKLCCGDLLRNAGNTVIAAVNLLRDGFRLQSGMLIRSVIETCATVFHLMGDKDAYPKFKTDRLDSNFSMSYANRRLPLFAKAWGLLSNFNIHINSSHAEWYPMAEYTTKDEIPSSVTLGILGYAVMLYDIVTELVFFYSLETPAYWENMEGGQFRFLKPTSERMDWFQEILKNNCLFRRYGAKVFGACWASDFGGYWATFQVQL